MINFNGMNGMDQLTAQQQWRAAARRAERQWCAAAAVMRLQWSLLLLGLLAWPGLMLVRSVSERQVQVFELALAVVVAALGVEALLVSWRRRPSLDQWMVFLEVAGQHHGQLLAAHEGRSIWPPCPKRVDFGWRWSWRQGALRPFMAMVAIAAGGWWPLGEKGTESLMSEPPTWQMTEQELRALSEQQWIDPAAVEPVLQQIEQWRAQPAEQWLAPAAVEASDQLWHEHERATEQWRQQVEQLQQAAQSLQAQPEKADVNQAKRAVEQWQAAIDAMDAARLKPNAALREKLQQLDPKHTARDPQRLKELSEQLRQHAAQLKKMQARRQGKAWAEGLDDQGLTQAEAEKSAKHKSGDKPGKSTNKPGSGGVNQGGGHDSQLLGEARAPQVLGDAQPLDMEDANRIDQGDLLQLQQQRHQRSEEPLALSSGGSAMENRGGERVWRENFHPDEQRSLKRFFDAE